MKSTQIRGYAEGYYGRLLSWSERLQVLDTLQTHELPAYYYAPKEDPCHRWQWRIPYDASWRSSFGHFCQQAHSRGITVVAGVAPGLDFDFSHLNDGADFHCLLNKCVQLLSDGADCISLLMDDIDANFQDRCGEFLSEGQAHAVLANTLSQALIEKLSGEPLPAARASVDCLWVTPRIYADELAAEEPEYLPAFLSQLNEQHRLLYCGSDVVSQNLSGTFDQLVRQYSKHRVIVWDNLYANDYCPRRLFVGSWQGRQGVSDILLNPTGLVYTDCLLLDMMASCTVATDSQVDVNKVRDAVLLRHGVPDAFLTLTDYFSHPVFNNNNADVESTGMPDNAVFESIEECLWCWKSALSREWYPFLFGLKHDLLIQVGQLPPERIRKTQNLPLAARLLDYK